MKKDAVANIFEKKNAYPGVFERVGSAFRGKADPPNRAKVAQNGNWLR